MSSALNPIPAPIVVRDLMYLQNHLQLLYLYKSADEFNLTVSDNQTVSAFSGGNCLCTSLMRMLMVTASVPP